MNTSKHTAEFLTDRWEDLRAVKNLMGKYVNCIVQNRDEEIFEKFWAKEPNVSLALNGGWYLGAEAVSGYYGACRDKNELVARILSGKFNEKSAEELFGAGTFRFQPITTPVVEIADDGKTAKGLWHCQGASAEVGTSGPVSYWTWGWFAVDFLREDDGWKIWHLRCLEDVRHPCGQSWGKEAEAYPDYPEFEPMRLFKMPDFTVAAAVREYYAPTRPFTKGPRVPEPYGSFADTFTYGMEDA